MIGIGVSRNELRVVALRREEVLWVTTVTRGRTASLSSVIEALLATRPPEVNGRVHVVAAIGTHESQLRPLEGLPPVRNAAELHAIISQNADRFFVREGGNLRISTPCVMASGDTWASAVEEGVLDEIAAGCRAANVPFVGALPVAAVLHHVARAENETAERQATWVGDGTRTLVTYVGWTPRRVLRERAADADTDGLAMKAAMPDTILSSHADAFAATRVRARDAFVIGEFAESIMIQRRSRVRTLILGGAIAASIVVAMVAPGVLSMRRTGQARSHLAVLRKKVGEADKVQRDLAEATTELNLVSKFQASRRSTTLLLGELAMALPESTAITALRIDSVGGSLSILTPHAAAAVESMSAVPGLHRVQVTGSMTRETTNGVDLERAAIRFGFAPAMRTP